MKEDKGWRISLVLIAVLFTFAVIGWAKYADEKKEVEIWQTHYSEAMDELRDAKANLDDAVYNIDGLREELAQCAEEKGLALLSRDNARADEAAYKELLKICMDGEVKILRGAPCHSHDDGIHCGWELCDVPEGNWQNYIDGLREELYACQDRVIDQRGYWHDAQVLCSQDNGCSSCMEMTDGNLEHCFTYAYYPR